MISRQQHIINKVFVEVNTANAKDAENIPKNMSLFLEDEVFPLIESLCEEYGSNENIFRIENLEIDCSVASLNQRDEIKQILISNLRKEVDKVVNPKLPLIPGNYAGVNGSDSSLDKDNSVIQIFESSQKQIATFVHFLEFGYLPWYAKEEDIKELVSSNKWEKKLEKDYLTGTLKILFSEKEVALNRFVAQCSNHVITDFIDRCKVISFRDKEGFVKLISDFTVKVREFLFTELIKVSVKNEPFGKAMTDLNSDFEFGETTSTDVRLFQEIIEEILRSFIQLNVYFEKETREKHINPFITSLKWILSSSRQKTSKEVLRSEKKETREKHINPLITSLKRILSSSGQKTSEEVLRSVKKETIPENNPTIFSERIVKVEKEKEPPFFQNNLSELFVRNAGLVLFHPFLFPLFSNFDWIDDQKQIKQESVLKAVQTLHYCATGRDDFFEANLVLEKFLCGFPLSEPVPNQSLLNPEIEAESELMIKSVIDHWKALKNTSPDGLREAFIRRNGKLIKKGKEVRLLVEQKTTDVLLGQLPWGISIIKLPWKKELLHVDWM